MGHNNFNSHVGLLLVVGFCLFCWWKGGRAERWGVSLILGANVIDTVIGMMTYANTPHLPAFVIDFLLAVSLLVLAIRYSSIWVGAAMLLQGAELAWYAIQSTGDGFNWREYARLANLQTALMLLSLVGGTTASWRRRIRARRKGAAGTRAPGVIEPVLP